MDSHPDAALRVITLHQTSSREDWTKALRDLKVSDSPNWTNYFIDGQANTDLVVALKIPGISNASYLVDPDGCVVHSNLGPITHIAVVERAIRLHERCVDAPAR